MDSHILNTFSFCSVLYTVFWNVIILHNLGQRTHRPSVYSFQCMQTLEVLSALFFLSV